MKKAIVVFILSLLMVTTVAFGAPPQQSPINLVGTWAVNMQTVRVNEVGERLDRERFISTKHWY